MQPTLENVPPQTVRLSGIAPPEGKIGSGNLLGVTKAKAGVPKPDAPKTKENPMGICFNHIRGLEWKAKVQGAVNVKCTYGDKCNLYHPACLEEIERCIYFKSGTCNYGKRCTRKHDEGGFYQDAAPGGGDTAGGRGRGRGRGGR